MLQRTSTGKGDAAPTGLLSRVGTERGTGMQRQRQSWRGLWSRMGTHLRVNTSPAGNPSGVAQPALP